MDHADHNSQTNPPEVEQPNRRAFLTAQAVRDRLANEGLLSDLVEGPGEKETTPCGGSTLRLVTQAMATEFAILRNERDREQIEDVSAALDLIHELEQQMTVYRDDSEMSYLNESAPLQPTRVSDNLYDLLKFSVDLSRQTSGAFDPTSGPLIALWRNCRAEHRIPSDDELSAAMQNTGIEHVRLDDVARTIAFTRNKIELNLGGIGKGYALDEVGEFLRQRGVHDWLAHGGQSSMLADGSFAGQPGWPVAIRNPLFPGERLATVRLTNRALGSSGSGVQYFRHQGRRYGHILDPRTGRAVDHLVSVTVLAPTAAEADALGTAFFVLGLENALQWCDNRRDVGALLIPYPAQGRRLEPVAVHLSPDELELAAGVHAQFVN